MENHLKKYPDKIENAVQSSVKFYIEKCLKELYTPSKMSAFIDFEKLPAHIHKIISDETAGDAE